MIGKRHSRLERGSNPMRIETLATCHNRLEKTLQAQADLHGQELPEFVIIVLKSAITSTLAVVL